MTLQILGVMGFVMFGYVLPEIAILLGSGKHPAPTMLNILCMFGACFISSYFMFA